MNASNATACSHQSNIARRFHEEVPVLRASSLGDEKFVEFLTQQARKVSGAQLVLSELNAQVAKGLRLDKALSEIRKMAEATVSRYPHLAAAFN